MYINIPQSMKLEVDLEYSICCLFQTNLFPDLYIRNKYFELCEKYIKSPFRGRRLSVILQVLSFERRGPAWYVD